ncbi:MFS transporter [Pseudomonas sp. SMV71]|uniref:MFS transporter n=1 Tax=Pseudomonas sp. SMV71 TaxID=3390195 RepID=UPI003F8697BC
MSAGYLSLLRERQFGSLFATQVTNVLATSISGLYLGTVVDAATGSTFLTSFAMFAPSLASLLGAASLMSLADTSSPRALMTALQLLSAICMGAQALPLPLWMRFVLLIFSGLLAAISSGLQLGLVVTSVGRDNYAMARSLLNLTNGAMQICGFAFAGALIQFVDPPPMFVALGILMALGACVVLWGIPPTPRPGIEPGIVRRSTGFAATQAVNKWALRHPNVRVLLLALWVPNGIVVGAESLFIPYAHDNAGYLLAAGAVGMLFGDLMVGRWMRSDTRSRINLYQRVLLAAPYLIFFIELPWMVAALLVLLASLGFSASLGLQERLVAHIPQDRIGQVQGLESSGRLAAQGIFALAAGGTAELLGAGYTITLFGALSLLVTASLMPRLARVNTLQEAGPPTTRAAQES